MAAVVSLPSGLLLVHQHGAFQALRATPRADSFETAVRLRPAAALEVPPALPLCAGACRCPAATDVVVFISADSDFPAVVVLHDLKLNVLYPVRCAGAAPVVGAGACMAHVGGDSVVLWSCGSSTDHNEKWSYAGPNSMIKSAIQVPGSPVCLSTCTV